MSLIRSLKDMVPHGLKAVFYENLRQKKLAETAGLGHLKGILDGITAVSVHDYLHSTLPGNSAVSAVPSTVSEIEINDSCNIDCVMCKTSLSKRQKGLMDLSLFEDVVARLAERGMRNTVLHTIGDPLANKNIAKYLEILRRNKFTISAFSSNCLLLDRHMDTIFEYRDVIYNFRPSIDAASKETYERIRFGGKWDVLHRNLLSFAEMNASAQNPFPVIVNNIISKENFHEIALIPHVFSYLAPPTDFRYAFINSLSPQNDYFNSQNYFEGEFTQNSPCSTIWNSVYVLKDGSLTTCCRDYDGDLVFGDVRSDNLETVYNDERLKAIRQAHLTSDVASMPALCQTCYTVDPRLSEFINSLFQYFFRKVKKHPMVLQSALLKIGPALKSKDFKAVMEIVQDM